MSFEKKTWVDRISEYPNRRTLVKEDGTSEIVTVSRSEGNISETGDALNASSMNDLEQRIYDNMYTTLVSPVLNGKAVFTSDLISRDIDYDIFVSDDVANDKPCGYGSISGNTLTFTFTRGYDTSNAKMIIYHDKKGYRQRVSLSDYMIDDYDWWGCYDEIPTIKASTTITIEDNSTMKNCLSKYTRLKIIAIETSDSAIIGSEEYPLRSLWSRPFIFSRRIGTSDKQLKISVVDQYAGEHSYDDDSRMRLLGLDIKAVMTGSGVEYYISFCN